MKEVGIDLADNEPTFLSEDLAGSASLLINGQRWGVPVVPGLPRDDCPLEDPKNKLPERGREIRDEFRARVQ